MDRRAVLGLGTAALLLGGAGPKRATSPGDLEGVWTLGSYTNLARPKELSKLVLTAAEAEAWEAPRRALNGMPPSKDGEVGQAESEFNERGDRMLKVRGEIRSSWIIDPPDGQIPWTAEAKARLGIEPKRPESFEGPEVRPVNERCVANFAAGAPMIGGPDANLVQIVQTKDAVVFLTEKYHDARIVRLGAPAGLADPPPSWLGDSRGRWEGSTLVVETSRTNPGLNGRGPSFFFSDATRVTERFTRTGKDEILYEFTVTDPILFTRPWRAETVLAPAPGRIFEYACHEGNYGLPDILAIARHEEARAAK